MNPYDQIETCDVCGLDASNCVCPECSICGLAGCKHQVAALREQEKKEAEGEWIAEANEKGMFVEDLKEEYRYLNGLKNMDAAYQDLRAVTIAEMEELRS